MPVDSARPVRRAQRTSSYRATKTRRQASPSTSSSSDEEDVVVIDVNQIRRARGDFYNKSPEERRRIQETTMPRQGPKEDRSSKKKRSDKSAVTVETKASNQSSHYRRRRRKSKEPDQDAEADYVYNVREVAGDNESAAPLRSRHRSSVSIEERRSSALPERVKVLRTLGLQPPQRTVSERAIRRPTQDPELRRHSYHEGSVARSASRSQQEINPVSRLRPKRSVSLRETASRASTRPPLSRSQTSVRKTRRSVPAMPSVAEETTKSQAGTKLGRSNSVFGSIFGPQKPAAPSTKVTCLTCMADDIPISRSAKLACTHRMCHDCLKRIFIMSVKDPAHMPPKCCTSDCIPLKHVERIFDDKFKVKWNRKYQEFTTKNRIYCPAKGCGTWIPPRDMHIDRETRKKYGKCNRCKTKVCATCNGKWHGSRPCQNDEETSKFQEMAKEEGWQRCYNCSAMVELKEGCNHMTCRCTAEFCMICGGKWKSCDCPWFNYAAVETDRLNHMNIAEVRREPWRANQPRGYHEELEQRRQQERRDEEMARRMQHLDIDVNLGAGRARRRGNEEDGGFGAGIFAVGNAADHFLNSHFVNRATNILAGPYDPAGRDAADRLIAEIRGNQRTADLAPLDAPVGQAELRRAATTGRRPTRPLGVVPGRGREAERLVPRRAPTDYASEAVRFQPTEDPPAPAANIEDEPPAAMLAGLQRRSNSGRVDAWRRHVT